MKTRLIIACAFALWSGAASGASAQMAGPGSPPLGVSVGRSIRECPQFTIFDDVDARVEGDAVVLTGKVTAASTRSEIERRVSRLEGVRDLRNEILVLPPLREDADLRHRVAKAIYSNPSFWSYAAMSSPPIHIIVERGHVILKGTVDTQVQRSMARSLATGLGERSLSSELRAER
jgi:hyperosmotically inducible periplasmic protein